MITVLADKNIPFLTRFLRDDARLLTFDPRDGIPDNIAADALLVRTVTALNSGTMSENLLKKLTFAGTASAGTDHIDRAFLTDLGIHFASAGGCNARAVAEYVATGLLHWCYAHQIPPQRLRVGVVGAGHTGQATIRLLQSLGFVTVVHDPPKARKEADFISAAKEDILKCDVITFHVPLTYAAELPEERDATHHWLKLDHITNSSIRLILNASRGGVVDETALKLAYVSGDLQDYILDVWEGEPVPVAAVLQDAWLATPHIAGYSVEAKVQATAMIVKQLYAHFGLEHDYLDSSETPALTDSEGKVQRYLDGYEHSLIKRLPDSLPAILEQIHPMFQLSTQLKQGVRLDSEELEALFVSLRTSEPLRKEYHNYRAPEKLMRKFPELNILLSN
ncbi:MAG: hypothetical protein JJU41_05850 [Bacteroidetes bacterium]|nr:hypothetical protein [Bacteroidota bacterium]